jgi:hypothetical protein
MGDNTPARRSAPTAASDDGTPSRISGVEQADTPGGVWRALADLTRKHDAAVAREEALRLALTAAQRAGPTAGGQHANGAERVEHTAERHTAELAAAVARAEQAETALAKLKAEAAQRAEASQRLSESQQPADDARAEAERLRSEASAAARAEAARRDEAEAVLRRRAEAAESQAAETRTALRMAQEAAATPQPSSADPQLVALTAELAAAKRRAEAAEQRNAKLEQACSEYEQTMRHTMGANSRASTESASRIGLLEAQNSRMASEAEAMAKQFAELSARYGEVKAKHALALQNEARWGDKLRDNEAASRATAAQLRSAGEEAVRCP